MTLVVSNLRMELEKLEFTPQLVARDERIQRLLQNPDDPGLVEINANRGAIVRSIGLDEVVNLYELRGAIFALACERLASRPTSALTSGLLAQVEAMEAAVAEGALEAYYRLNVAFHASILEQSGNPRARSTYEGFVKEMHLFRRRGLSIATNIAQRPTASEIRPP